MQILLNSRILLLHTRIRSTEPAKFQENALSEFSPVLRKKVRSFSSLKRQQQFLYGRMLLLEGLRRMDSLFTPDDVVALPDTKPVIPDGPQFSISHSSDVVCCALSENLELGLDVEIHRELNPANFRPWFSKDELEAIRLSDTPLVELIRRWTIKEALYKGSGREISLSETGSPVGEWFITPLHIADNFEAALACKEAAPEIIQKYIPDEYLSEQYLSL